jgi:hypothetical protein
MIASKTKPGGNRASSTRHYLNAADQLYRSRASIPHDWRERLPDPAVYYGQRIEKLSAPNAQGWAQGRCPFHEDKHASLSVHIAKDRGGFKCFTCGAHGDMVAFHERLTGLPFKQAARDLIGLGVNR